jgi:hypothetical protein
VDKYKGFALFLSSLPTGESAGLFEVSYSTFVPQSRALAKTKPVAINTRGSWLCLHMLFYYPLCTIVWENLEVPRKDGSAEGDWEGFFLAPGSKLCIMCWPLDFHLSHKVR